MKKLKIITLILVVFLASCNWDKKQEQLKEKNILNLWTWNIESETKQDDKVDLWHGFYKQKGYIRKENINHSVTWKTSSGTSYLLDIDSFKMLSDFYAKDKNKYFFFLENQQTFIPIPQESNLKIRVLTKYYAVIWDKLYYKFYPIYSIEWTEYMHDIEIFPRDYSKYLDKIYYKNFLLKVDSETFELINTLYSKDKNWIYYFTKKIQEADLETFEVLKWGYEGEISYAKDKNNCYKNAKIVDISECDNRLKKLKKFINIEWKNKTEYISLEETIWEEQWEIIDYVPIKEFVFNNSNLPSIKTSNCANINDLFTIDDIDEDWDIELGMYYSWCTWKLKQIKVFSFVLWSWREIWTWTIDAWEYNEDDFSKIVFKTSKNNLQIHEKYTQPSNWKDKDSYKIIYFNGYSGREIEEYKKENKVIYYKSQILNEVDFDSFSVLDDDFAKDKDYIYFKWEKHPELDVETFELLDTCWAYSQCYARDKNYVYDPYDLSIFEWLDWTTFEVLDDSHQKDKNHVYLWNKIIKWANPETFKPITMCSHVMKAHYGIDENYWYYNWRKIENSNWKTFEVLWIWPCEYAKDKNNMYYRWKVLEWANSETFEYIAEDRKEIETCDNQYSPCYEYSDFSKDDKNCYKNAEKVEMSECDDFLKELDEFKR